MRIYLCLFVLLLFGSCSTGPKTAGSENVEEPIVAQRLQPSKASLSPPNPIRLLRRSGDTLTDDPMAGGEVVEIGFFDEKGQLIKTIRPPDLNPYTDIGHGFELQPPIEYSRGRYIKSEQSVLKRELKKYLPSYLYNEIPPDWKTNHGIVLWDYGTYGPGDGKYISINYWLEWNPVPEEVFSGNYAVTTAIILDERGEVYLKKQFDGIIQDVVVSDDGDYLLTSFETYPASRGEKNKYRKNVRLIRLKDGALLWQESAAGYSIRYSLRRLSTNVLWISKVKDKSEERQVFVIDVKSRKVMNKVLDMRKIKGIHGAVGDSIYSAVPGEDTIYYKISETFQEVLNF